MLSVCAGDSQVFQIRCWESDGITPAVPVSGYFTLTRINDGEIVISPDGNITISGQNVFYTLSGTQNTILGFMKYNFVMDFDAITRQTLGGYVEIISRRE